MRIHVLGGVTVRRVLFLVVPAVTVLAVTALAIAASSPNPTTQPAVFAVQGKVLQVGKGWFQVQAVKVQRGSGLRANANLRVLETAKTKILRPGKPVSLAELKIGEMVRIAGSGARRAKT